MPLWARELKQLGDLGLALLLPRACDLCGGSVETHGDGPACAACWSETELYGPTDRLCEKCGVPMGHAVAGSSPPAVHCRRCDDDQFVAARALGPYAGALRATVLALKRRPETGDRLAQLLGDLAAVEPLNQAELILPIPLHPEREKERGFNQAAAIAAVLSRRTGLPVNENSLIRERHTARHRAEMDARARRESVQQTFAVAHRRRIKDRSILLVDDVLTTGATLSACATVLLAAGAKQVFGLTIARAK